MSDKITLLQSEAERIVNGEELSDDVQDKLDLMLDRGHTCERIEEYLSERIEDTLCDRIIRVPIPGAVKIEMDRSELDNTHGNPYSIGVDAR